MTAPVPELGVSAVQALFYLNVYGLQCKDFPQSKA